MIFKVVNKTIIKRLLCILQENAISVFQLFSTLSQFSNILLLIQCVTCSFFVCEMYKLMIENVF